MASGPGTAERRVSEPDVRLRPRGAGRFFDAAFLLVWLCLWAAGEAFVLSMLVLGVVALVTGQPPATGREPLDLAPTLGIGLFLLFWLALWTVGGIAAAQQLLQLLWAEDHLRAGPDGLVLERMLGPFRSRLAIAREQLRAIRTSPSTTALVAITSTRTVEMSRLGTQAEREEAAIMLESELHLEPDDDAASAFALPDDWEETVTPEGDAALVGNLATRSKQARVAAVTSLVVATVTLVMIEATTRNPSLLAFSIVLAALSAALTWGAVWLARGRMEWRVGAGRMVLQRRFGSGVRELFTATRLELTVTSDSDGDPWFELEALAPGAVSAAADTWIWPPDHSSRRKHRRRVWRVMHDDVAPRRLGQWLAQRTGLPFQDLTTPEARQEELGRLRSKLAAAGRWGRLANRLLDRLGRRSRNQRG